MSTETKPTTDLVAENTMLKTEVAEQRHEISGLKYDRDLYQKALIKEQDSRARAVQGANKMENDLGKVRNAIGSIKFDEITKK